MFKDFYEDLLPVESFNYGIVTLLPKKVDATQIQQFRPICPLSVCFKIYYLIKVK